MHDVTNFDVSHRPTEDNAPGADQRYETRMAWIASLWAAMAVLATAIAIWDAWRVSP
jgi:hypothetical protein